VGSTQAINFNDKIRLKLPRKRLYRTNSIAKEFRDRGFYFEWFSKNSISFEIPKKELRESKRVVYLTGSLVCYKVRVDVWYFANDHAFQYYEIIEPHGRALLFTLCELDILPSSFLPSITPYHSKLNQL
jgi:hypothetical protein